MHNELLTLLEQEVSLKRSDLDCLLDGVHPEGQRKPRISKADASELYRMRGEIKGLERAQELVRGVMRRLR